MVRSMSRKYRQQQPLWVVCVFVCASSSTTTCQSNTHRILVSQVNWYWFYRRFLNTLKTLHLQSTHTHISRCRCSCRRWIQRKVSVHVSWHVYLAQKATRNTDKTSSSTQRRPIHSLPKPVARRSASELERVHPPVSRCLCLIQQKTFPQLA